MSGHSKWSQIKHKKALVDAKKGKIFSKLARAISVAARGDPDPTTNLRLKAEVDRAHAFNMPSDNIERAIKRVGDRDADTLERVEVDVIGPAGVGIIVEALTDNTNRTINEIKQVLSRRSARMAGQGSLTWMFRRTDAGLEVAVPVPLPDPAQQSQLEALMDALDELDDVQDVHTNADY